MTTDIVEWVIVISGVLFSAFGLAAACYGVYAAVKDKQDDKQ